MKREYYSKKEKPEDVEKMAKCKELTNEIHNAERRLQRLKEQRVSRPEVREAFENAPLAHHASMFVEHLDKKIKEEEDLIAHLEKDLSELKE